LFIWTKSRNRTAAAESPAATRPAPVASGAAKLDDGAVNPWDLAQIWIESVTKEASSRKQWQDMYGWMAEYDPKVILIWFSEFQKNSIEIL
jgi:hypothetical protein